MSVEPFAVPPTVAIGGLGGSGTRVVAKLLAELGLYLGGDLNDALDNLWFTLLFKRRSILSTTATQFNDLFAPFRQRMSGLPLSAHQTAPLREMIEQPRLLHERNWLEERLSSFASTMPHSSLAWGWKEPNTHIIIDRLLAAEPTLRYVHVVRDALYMANSRNQNQLQLWGPVLLDRDVQIAARDALSYWCLAHQRVLAVAADYRTRVLVVDFDELCVDPKAGAARIAAFAGLETPPGAIEDWARSVEYRRRTGVTFEYQAFDSRDLDYVAACGYRP